MNFSLLLAVGTGGFIGAILRFSLSGWVQKSTNILFPFGTLFVNVLGSFLIGFLFLYFQEINLSAHQKALFITGLLGALTTFSTFSLETLTLIQDGFLEKALLNIGLNIALCLFATYLGMMLFKRLYGV
jgi:CrcB protein